MWKQVFLMLLLLTIVDTKLNNFPCDHFVKTETILPPEQIATIIDNETSYLFRIINFTDFSFHFLKFNDTLCTYLYMDQIFGIESDVLPSVFTNDRCRNSATTCSVSSLHVDNITHTYMYDVNYTDTTPFRYFTGLDIYFTETKCTQLFLELVNFKTLTNADVFNFLFNNETHDHTCPRSLRLLSEKNIYIFPPEIEKKVHRSWNFKIEAIDIVEFAVFDLYFHTLTCLNMFTDYVTSKSNLSLIPEFQYKEQIPLLSAMDINMFTEEYSCELKRSSDFTALYLLCAKHWLIYTAVTIANFITIVNIFVIYIFLMKENLSPVTIILCFLASSDTASVLCGYYPQLINISYSVYEREYDYYTIVMVKYPLCIVSNRIENIGHDFHLISILLTTMLCVLKTTVVMFPFCSKNIITNKFAIVSSLFVVFLSVGISLFSFMTAESYFAPGRNDICVGQVEYLDSFNTYDAYVDTIVFVIFAISLIIVFICTIYLCAKLTCLRRNLQWTDSKAMQLRNRRSAVMVVLIAIIFLVSEATNAIERLDNVLPIAIFSKKIHNALETNSKFPVLIGNALNFIVYLTISQQFRAMLWNNIRKLWKPCRHC